MKELKLAIQSDFSDCAIEDSIDLIAKETKRHALALELTVSVFDAAYAVKMMIDLYNIRNIKISKMLHYGEYLLTDSKNEVQVIGGISR